MSVATSRGPGVVEFVPDGGEIREELLAELARIQKDKLALWGEVRTLKIKQREQNRRIRRYVRFFFFYIVLNLIASLAFGANCGDTTGGGGAQVVCACGDKVTTSTVLTQDYACTGTHGLIIGNGTDIDNKVVLDCNGHSLTGNQTAFYGIYFQNTKYAEVRNCTITNFGDAGVRFRNAFSNSLVDNVIYGNGNGSGEYNVEFAISADGANGCTAGTFPCTFDNLVHGNTIYDPGDENIHFGGGSSYRVGGDGTASYPGNILDSNTIYDAPLENLYLLQTQYNIIRNNDISHGVKKGGTYNNGTAIYLKDANYNTIEGNTIRTKVVHLVNASHDNTFLDNSLLSQGYYFQYESGFSPTNNLIFRGTVNAPSGNCLRAGRSSGNKAVDLVFLDCSDDVYVSDEGSGVASSLTIINPNGLNASNYFLSGNSSFDVGWTVDGKARTLAGAPIENATLVLRKHGDGTQIFSATTGADGSIAQQQVIAFRQAVSTLTEYGPFDLTTSATAMVSNFQGPFTLTAPLSITATLLFVITPVVKIESPVFVAAGSQYTAEGNLTLRGAGQFYSETSGGQRGFSLNVTGTLTLEKGAVRIRANRLKDGGGIAISTGGDLVVRGGIDSAATAITSLDGGDLTLFSKGNVTIEGAVLLADGGRDRGTGGFFSVFANGTITIEDATLRSAGFRGGSIVLAGEKIIILGKSHIEAFGKTLLNAGTITLDFISEVQRGNFVVINPTPILVDH